MRTEPITLGEMVHMMRARLNLSARELSNRSGLSASYITKLEANELQPSLRAFAKIASACRMSSREVLFCVAASTLGDPSPEH